MRIETKIFKGKPVLSFFDKPDATYPRLSFGVGKAKIILEHVEVIRAFVTANPPAEKVEATDAA